MSPSSRARTMAARLPAPMPWLRPAWRLPVRVVLDSQARLAPTAKLATGARQAPVWLLCSEAAPAVRREALRKAGVEIVDVPAGGDGRIDIAEAARVLGARGLTRVL